MYNIKICIFDFKSVSDKQKQKIELVFSKDTPMTCNHLVFAFGKYS